MTTADATRRFWSASVYIRRGQDRDKTVAINVLKHLTENATGKVQTRAAALLKEIHGK